jgi:hypothetical protein
MACGSACDWSSDVCSSDLLNKYSEEEMRELI